jgi:hypothetical protein
MPASIPVGLFAKGRSAFRSVRTWLASSTRYLTNAATDHARALRSRIPSVTEVRGAVRPFIREVVWPPGVGGKLGRILATLSALSLVQHGFTVGIAGTLRILLEYYDALVGALLGWAQPYIENLVQRLTAPMHWDLKVLPHWKHIFVLLTAYFFRSAAINWAYGYRGAARFCAVWGALVALTASVAAGTIGLAGSVPRKNLAMVAIPVAGIFVFDMAKQLWNATFIREQAARVYGREMWTWWEFFRPNLLLVLSQTVASLAIAWGVLQVPVVRQLPSPGLAALALLILGLALYRIGIGASEVKGLRKHGEAWSAAFWRTNSAGVGASLLGLTFWVTVFLLTNAGLRFYGL